jgi:hypothetical protein
MYDLEADLAEHKGSKLAEFYWLQSLNLSRVGLRKYEKQPTSL